MLITLDPVGLGELVWRISHISSFPENDPQAKVWINITSTYEVGLLDAIRSKSKRADYVADFGERWKPTGLNVQNVEINKSHNDMNALFNAAIVEKKTAIEWLIDDIKSLIPKTK